MKHQISTFAVLVAIAVSVTACGEQSNPPGQTAAVAHSANRVYESDLVSEALAKSGNRVYESDIVSEAVARTQNRVYESDLVSGSRASTE